MILCRSSRRLGFGTKIFQVSICIFCIPGFAAEYGIPSCRSYSEYIITLLVVILFQVDCFMRL